MMAASSARAGWGGFLAAIAVALGVATVGPGQAEAAQVFVVHGVPGQPMDLYVDGERVLPDLRPGDVAGPLELRAGRHDVATSRPGEPVSSPIVEADDVRIPGEASLTLAVHLAGSGEPTVTRFVNDATPLDAGQARVTVRHTAAAPAVDLRVGERVDRVPTPTFTGLANRQQATAELPAGPVTLGVVRAGSRDAMIPPAELTLAEGTLTIVYAIGSAEPGTLDLVVQVVGDLETAPAGVPAGNGGMAAAGSTVGVPDRDRGRGPGQLPRPDERQVPATLGIPQIGLTAPVTGVGVDPETGELALPPADRAGWYRFGPGLEATRGSVVIAGHVDSRRGPGVFFRLAELALGDRIGLTAATGESRTFQVVETQVYAKAEVPLERFFARDGSPRLTLITCTGEFDRRRGGYYDNLVVTAVPAGPGDA